MPVTYVEHWEANFCDVVIILSQCYYWAPVGERSITIILSVCLSVRLSVCICLSASISLEPLDRSSRNCLCRSPVATSRSFSIWRRCDTLCTSGFMDDVTFGCSGPYGDAWTAAPQPTTAIAALRYWGGVGCLWMPCCWCCFRTIVRYCAYEFVHTKFLGFSSHDSIAPSNEYTWIKYSRNKVTLKVTLTLYLTLTLNPNPNR